MKNIVFHITNILIIILLLVLVFIINSKVSNIEEEVKKETIIQIKEVIVKEKIEPQFEIFEATAYTDGFESTGKNPGDLNYGFTASGEPTIEGRTIACPRSMDFGTAVYIPMFENVFFCTDRGSDITEGKIDIYMYDLEQAINFGRRNVEVFILP